MSQPSPGKGAGPITVTKYRAGKPVKTVVLPAPTIETTRDPVNKRGPKPGAKGEMAAREARFAASANWY